ncbi:hypothetical protein [Halostagnicola larsenii]|nr:hypothetical protein [Halostagnicola larsenii]
MTDHAINFTALLEEVRAFDEHGESNDIVTVSGDDPFAVCQSLFRRLGDRTATDRCEFVMSHTVRRELERTLVRGEPTIGTEPFLERQIRTDVSMPDDVILFADFDAITLGGTVLEPDAVGLGESA